jgi:hypothetical protein
MRFGGPYSLLVTVVGVGAGVVVVVAVGVVIDFVDSMVVDGVDTRLILRVLLRKATVWSCGYASWSLVVLCGVVGGSRFVVGNQPGVPFPLLLPPPPPPLGDAGDEVRVKSKIKLLVDGPTAAAKGDDDMIIPLLPVVELLLPGGRGGGVDMILENVGLIGMLGDDDDVS